MRNRTYADQRYVWAYESQKRGSLHFRPLTLANRKIFFKVCDILLRDFSYLYTAMLYLDYTYQKLVKKLACMNKWIKWFIEEASFLNKLLYLDLSTQCNLHIKSNWSVNKNIYICSKYYNNEINRLEIVVLEPYS